MPRKNSTEIQKPMTAIEKLAAENLAKYTNKE